MTIQKQLPKLTRHKRSQLIPPLPSTAVSSASVKIQAIPPSQVFPPPLPTSALPKLTPSTNTNQNSSSWRVEQKPYVQPPATAPSVASNAASSSSSSPYGSSYLPFGSSHAAPAPAASNVPSYLQSMYSSYFNSHQNSDAMDEDPVPVPAYSQPVIQQPAPAEWPPAYEITLNPNIPIEKLAIDYLALNDSQRAQKFVEFRLSLGRHITIDKKNILRTSRHS